MSGSATKLRRREIRRAFGEPVAQMVGAHEGGLTDHGRILSAIVLGPLWARLLWLACGSKAVFWVRAKLSRGTDGIDAGER